MQQHPALLDHLDALHTTPLGAARILQNLSLKTCDVVDWCKTRISAPHAVITRRGKNWYVDVDGCRLTIHAKSYTLITAHRTAPKQAHDAK